jgi:hypothetical protein
MVEKNKKNNWWWFGLKDIACIFAPAFRKILPESLDDSVAQLVEHNTFNVGVLGSSPSGITELQRLLSQPLLFIILCWGDHAERDRSIAGSPSGITVNEIALKRSVTQTGTLFTLLPLGRF